MDEFLTEVGAYARKCGLSPSTVLQNAAKCSGQAWSLWLKRIAFPTARTMDRVRGYMRDNPPPPQAEADLS